MKQFILNLLLWLGIAMPAFADNTVTVSSAEGRPGDEVEVTVSLTNTDAIVAAEVTIPLGDYLQYVDGSATLNASRADGHQLSAASVDGALRLYVYDFAGLALVSGDGMLATFRLRLGKHPQRFTLVPRVILSDASGQSLPATIQQGMVTTITPELTVAPPQIDFGHIPIRSTYTKTLTLQNSGTDVLTVSGITFDASELSALETAFTIAPGATKNVTVQYAPVKHGATTHKVTVFSDAINGRQTAIVVADPFSVNELHVANASGISDTEATVVITMNNMEPIVAAQCTFALPDGLRYVDGSVAAGSHAAGLSATATVQNKKLTLFLYSQSNVAIPEGDGEIITFRLHLEGCSGTYYLTPQDVVLGNARLDNMVSASTRGSVQIQSPTISGNASLNMGTMPVTEAAEAIYAIRNTGQVDLVVNNISFLAEGFSIKEELPLTIAKGTSKNITVCYALSEEGSFRTTMNIYSNDPVTRLKNVTVSGDRYEPNDLTISNSVANDNQEVRVTIGMNNVSSIAALQMDVHWVEGMSLTANDIVLKERVQGFSSTVVPMDATTYRVVLFSFNNQPVAGNSGDLFELVYHNTGCEFNQTTITIDNVLISNLASENRVSPNMHPQTIVLKRCAVVAVSGNAAIGNVALAGDEQGFVDYGTRVTFTATPLEGCAFAGWHDGERIVSTEKEYAMNVLSDVEFTALFMREPHKLTYMVDGEEYYSTMVETGSAVAPMAYPTKEGYDFSGWDDEPTTMPAADVVVKGVFYVSELALSETALEMNINESCTLLATVAATGDAYDNVEWTVSNPNLLKMVKPGVFKATHPGDVTITVSDQARAEVQATCEVHVTNVILNDKPSEDFEFNFNFCDYDAAAHSVPNHEKANLSGYNMQIGGSNYPTFAGDHIIIDRYTQGYLDKWPLNSTESGKYFYRSGQDNMTIIAKVAPKLGTGNASDFISNRYGGYNYMLRIGDHNTVVLHTGTAWSTSRSMPLNSEEPQILVVRANGKENYIQYDNLTTGESLKINNVNWGGSNNVFKFFYNDAAEYYTGGVYWMYYSFNCLTDEEAGAVADYNENYGNAGAVALFGDVNNDGKVTMADAVDTMERYLNWTEPSADDARYDINGDGKITVSDAIEVMNIYLSND